MIAFSEEPKISSQSGIVEELLEDGLADWVSLQNVVWLCTRGTINPDTKQAVLDVLHLLYSEGLMVPGELGKKGFEDWAPPSGTWVIRSEMALDALEWQPMGDGLWLRLTTRGKSLARSQREATDADLVMKEEDPQ
ncbi:hypothetical protein [Paenarthrobacter sp. NCHU4564]|uniref:hypothetical protein n=1 Tax=Paenarthrobacter sp. NCHU4564 TaxID=3451353 RepID=UPI003F9B1588